jgi:hypothetical protein
MDGMLQQGQVNSYAELAALGHVTRARITQIMNLLHLAPDIQEEILFLDTHPDGRESLRMKHLAPIAKLPYWKKQRRAWQQLSHLQH